MWAPGAILTILLGARCTTAAAVPQTTTRVIATTITAGSNDTVHRGPPSILQDHKDWHNPTCYWDLYADDRLLPARTSPPLTQNIMTVQICVDYCASAGYRFAGVEFGVECYCGHDRPDKKWKGSNQCDFACMGNKLEVCGGKQSLLVYELPCRTVRQCYDDIAYNETLAAPV